MPGVELWQTTVPDRARSLSCCSAVGLCKTIWNVIGGEWGAEWGREYIMLFLSLLFWGLLASCIVHILDEALLNGGFVQWIADNFWPTYTWRMFFWFNAGALAAIATSNLLFDSLGGHWVILPLIWVAGFVTHVATVHVYWTIRRNT